VGDPSVPADTSDSSVFFANVDTDTDYAVRALPGGMESYHLIRSPASPETFSLDLHLPVGAAIRKAPDEHEGFLVQRGDETLYRVSVPAAWDADERAIPVETRITGSTIEMTIKHRSGDWLYPLVLDPSVFDNHYYLWGDTNNGGWRYQCFAQCGAFAPSVPGNGNTAMGVDTYANIWPSQWAKAEYVYATPGETAQIWYTQFLDTGNVQNRINGSTCHYTGIYSPARGGWERDNYGNNMMWQQCSSFSGQNPRFCTLPERQPTWSDPQPNCIDWGGTQNNYAVFGTLIPNAGYRVDWVGNYIRGAQIGISDFTNPEVYGGMPSAVDPSTRIDPWVRDTGVGLGHIRMTSPTDPTWGGFDHQPDCYGTSRWRCPRDFSYPVGVGNLRPGKQTIRVEVWDKVGNYTFRDYAIQNYSTSWNWGGADHAVNTTDEADALREAMAGLEDDDWIDTWEGLTASDQVLVVPASQRVSDTESNEAIASKRRGWHWGWFHLHKYHTDENARTNATRIENAADAEAALAIAAGSSGAAPAAVVAGVASLGMTRFARNIRNSADKSGPGVDVDAGLWCYDVPGLDPCYPRIKVRP
jgi:hypothetical protein